MISFGLLYGIFAIIVKSRLRINSTFISKVSFLHIKTLQEGLGSIVEIILNNSHNKYLLEYRKYDRKQRLLLSQNQFISYFPRFIIEGISLSVFAFASYILIVVRGNSEALVSLGAFALGSARLLPCVQQTFNSWSTIIGTAGNVQSIKRFLDLSTKETILLEPPNLSYEFTRLSLIDVGFTYSSPCKNVLTEINLEITKGQSIGIKGSTGSGKTTLVSILTGLIKPSKGSILLNSEDVYDLDQPHLLLQLRSMISYVPQQIFLMDTTIAANIALQVGVDNDIDFNLVKDCARAAHLESFILSLPYGYNTIIGEGGSKLSGGQRQRLGIARALYRNTDILVLDEATSALDSDTEEKIISEITTNHTQKTIIMIAHRVSTLRNCDKIITLTDGSIKY